MPLYGDNSLPACKTLAGSGKMDVESNEDIGATSLNVTATCRKEGNEGIDIMESSCRVVPFSGGVASLAVNGACALHACSFTTKRHSVLFKEAKQSQRQQ